MAQPVSILGCFARPHRILNHPYEVLVPGNVDPRHGWCEVTGKSSRLHPSNPLTGVEPRNTHDHALKR